VDKTLTEAGEYDSQRQVIANQALQNAVETANMVGKQTVRHADLAVDRQWNIDEQGYTAQNILNDAVFQDAIASAVTKIVADMTTKKK